MCIQQAINLFVASLVNDLRQMERDGHHLVFGKILETIIIQCFSKNLNSSE